WYPTDEPPLPEPEIARRLLDTQLRWCGFARRDRFGFAFDGPPPGREEALAELVAEGRFVPVTVEGTRGEWLAHAEMLEQAFRPRTTLLSPFDPLIKDRDFTEEIFGFRYRLEIYVPKDEREYGYFVLPILHGDRLVGRIDPLFDRKARVLRVNRVYAEPDAPEDAGRDVTGAIRELAEWLGADVSLGTVAPQWKPAFAAFA
ncbi:MAG: winged helix DNA-binding domain-containing protein, partial [Actinomycetota bacterium]|nr:winged helix DNA-binding domain-containing protein [Actinomycetota bacterium]